MRILWNMQKLALAALICVVVGAGGLLLLHKQGALTEETVPVDIEEHLDGSALQSFAITATTPDVTFVKGSTGDIRVHLTGTIHESYAKYMNVTLTAGDNGASAEAVVRTTKPYNVGIDVGQVLTWFNNDLKVTVELPDHAYRSLKVHTDTGTITLSGIRSDTLDLKTDTGGITLEEYTGKRLTATSDTGTMRLRKIDAELDLSSDTGDLYADLSALKGGIDLRTDTGDIQLTLAQAAPLTVDFASDTGRTNATASSGPFDYQSKEKHRLLGKLNGGGPLIKARSDTGSIQLNVK
ncbi:DUF4097 family beta strand repeat-containing protein [Gorillibacterium sp. sgz5001074]|uniref:DUF4097 family beta strand repeat-containing protein n=1 Tax=Gorillibacterium sp. sgz5001074 TaxID=3446695 RepID=UPI003F66ED9C